MSQFSSIKEFVEKSGGKRVIQKILVANNGQAAVKGIRSIRAWANKVFQNDKIITFVVMATPDDIKANAEYIRLADELVEVPGNSTLNNYSNVNLVVDLAERVGADAVFAGWGHASENPLLPDSLAKAGITFIGPTSRPMRLLGDKISSTIVAATAGVPIVPWSGSEVKCGSDYEISDELYLKACVTTVEEALISAAKVGFPLMIKASAGGGGKGIRKVKNEDELKIGFGQVALEVPGSPIFLMKLGVDCRHLEVQVIADDHGNAISLFSRDCSIQRRHQKIIEEGPVTGAPKDLVAKMERNAVALCKAVGYLNAGTVEFLYTEGKYYFLELNPRLQVEHPVTEWITGVNIPATQLQIAMGIPLYRIADIRSFYMQDPQGDSVIDFDTAKQREPDGHVIAVRITAENAEENFQPTSGSIVELHFKNSPDVWGYFSVRSLSGIHQFSDSQFGHVFAHGFNREDARKKMILALGELSIRGDIRETSQYVRAIMKLEPYINNDITTSYLDGLIANKFTTEKPDVFLAVTCGAVHSIYSKWKKNQETFIKSFERGQQPGSDLLTVSFPLELIYDNIKYIMETTCNGPAHFTFSMNGSSREVEIKEMRDGGLLVLVNGESHVTYSSEDPSGVRVTLDGVSVLFTKEFDPSTIRANSSGKFVRFLVDDGARITTKQAIAEIEMMKMIITLYAPLSGVIHFQLSPGTPLKQGDIIATLELDDPTQIKRSELFEGKLPEQIKKIHLKPHQVMRAGVTEIQTLLDGYDYPGNLYDKKLDAAIQALRTIGDPKILISQFSEKFAPFKVQVPLAKQDAVDKVIKESASVDIVISKLKELLADNLTPFSELFGIFEGGAKKYALTLLTNFATRYLSVEKIYAGKNEESVFYALRDAHKSNFSTCYEIALSHASLKKKNKVMLALLKEVEAFGLVNDFLTILDSFATLIQPAYSSVALVAKHMIMRSQMPSFERMRTEMEEIFKSAINEPSNRDKILSQVTQFSNFAFDILMTFFSHENKEIRQLAAEVYVRKAYTTFDNSCLKYQESDKFKSITWKFTKTNDLEGADLKDGIVGSASVENLHDETEDYTGFGAMTFFENLQDLQVYLPSILPLYESSDNDNDSINILNVCLKWREKEIPNDEYFINTFTKIIETYEKVITPYDIRRITLVVDRKDQFPFYYTFRERNGYKEDPIYRHIEPTLAFQLYLRRMSHYHISPFPLANPSVHIYYAKPKKSDRYDALQKRFFVRVLVLKGDIFTEKNPDEFQIAELERLTLDAMNALGVAMSDSRFDKTYANNLFINILPTVVYKPDNVGELFSRLQKNHAQKLRELRVNEVEVRVKIKTSPTATPLALRFTAKNVTGFQLQIAIYKEATNPKTGKLSYSSLIGKELPLNGVDLNSPHTLLTQAEQKREIAHDYETTYVYDYPELFDMTLKQIWKVYYRQRKINNAKDIPELLKCQELILNSKGQLEPTSESHIGKNNYGMVVWKMTMKTPEYPDGRSIIVVANDITYQSGSFSVLEDDIFFAASELARKERIPRIFINANSGARIGLAKEVQKAFKICWNSDEDPSKGAKYLYIEDSEYPKLSKSINAEKVVEDGQVRWKIIDIIGQEDGIGVENLKGSGKIAGETSKAYKDIFTINYVASRTVGIGAYLVRLGQRVIQHRDVPIILTGNAAINKVLGRDVYTSNRQLGGIGVMYTNGVSHLVVNDDFKGILSILRWLSYVPCKSGSPLPCLASLDPIERPIEWSPVKGEQYDPRNFIAGVTHGDQWISGFFDKDSWIETLGGWALTVVTGRAKLGGIPVGVIAVETRSVETRIPADPADSNSQEQVLMKAGQVWYPDSAYKTSQAIKDFNNGEELPLFIFANWRGFSGGQRDMFNEILKFGSYIVDELRDYKKPVFIYIPPFGELRGGAWVVVDPTINPEMMEMYADVDARGGILEPSGTVEIKFRKTELLETIRKLDSTVIQLNKDLEGKSETERKDISKKISERENSLLPVYLSIAEQFCNLHDTPGRMKAKDCLREVLVWKKAREYFYWRLKRRLTELELISKIPGEKTFFDKQKVIKEWIVNDVKSDIWNDDRKVLEWIEASQTTIQIMLNDLEKQKISSCIQDSFEKDLDSSIEGLIKFLNISGKKDEILRMLQK